MPPPKRPRATRLAALGAVLALHGILWLALLALRERPSLDPAAATGPEPAVLWLRGVAPDAPGVHGAPVGPSVPPARIETAPRPPRAAAAAPALGLTWVAPASSGPGVATPLATSSASAGEPGPADDAASVDSAASAAARTPALRLSLPRGAAGPRNPALDDPRANTRSHGLEARLAATLGGADGPITEERLSDGTLRLRRGSRCVLVRPSRQAQIDPFNESISPKARGVESCN